MSDSEDSDISVLFQQAAKSRIERERKEARQSSNSANEDDDDNSSEESSVVLLSNMNRGSKRDEVSAKLQNLAHRKAINDRKRRAELLRDDDDDSVVSDDDGVKVSETPVVAVKRPPTVDTSLLESSDEDHVDCTSGTLNKLEQDGVMNHETATELKNLQDAAKQILHKKRYDNNDESHEVDQNVEIFEIDDDDDNVDLTITVHAAIHSTSETKKSTTINIPESQTVQDLMDRVLMNLGLDTSTHVICISRGDKVWHPRQLLSLFSISSTCDVHATITSDLDTTLTQGNKTNKQNFGRRILVKVRMGNTEKSVGIGMNEPIRSLVDQIGQGDRIQLNFDGDKMDVTRTPSFYDMESDDIVDVMPL